MPGEPVSIPRKPLFAAIELGLPVPATVYSMPGIPALDLLTEPLGSPGTKTRMNQMCIQITPSAALVSDLGKGWRE